MERPPFEIPYTFQGIASLYTVNNSRSPCVPSDFAAPTTGYQFNRDAGSLSDGVPQMTDGYHGRSQFPAHAWDGHQNGWDRGYSNGLNDSRSRRVTSNFAAPATGHQSNRDTGSPFCGVPQMTDGYHGSSQFAAHAGNGHQHEHQQPLTVQIPPSSPSERAENPHLSLSYSRIPRQGTLEYYKCDVDGCKDGRYGEAYTTGNKTRMERHVQKQGHLGITQMCPVCRRSFARKDSLNAHVRDHH